jgi:hypothetical protein
LEASRDSGAFIAIFRLSAERVEMQHAFDSSAEIAENFAFASKNSRLWLLTRLPPNFAPENQLPRGDSRKSSLSVQL